MKATSASASWRGPFDGLLQIVRFNWRLYLVAMLLGGAILAVMALSPMPRSIRWGGWACAGCVGYWMLASLAASHWIYDRSKIYDWAWIKEALPDAPQCWANIHAGLDDSSPALEKLFPETQGVVLDIFDPAEMTEPSIVEARRARPGSRAEKASLRALPLATGGLDAVFLIFAAHEIRSDEARREFFAELRRVLKPGGAILLVEHLRDFNNFLAFGPGFFHFQPRSVWMSAARNAGLAIEREFRMTPFVRVFLLAG